MERFFLVMDVGGTSVKLGFFSDRHGLIAKSAVPVAAPFAYAEVVAAAFHEAEALAKRAGVALGDVQAAGVGIPGLPRRQRGEAAFCPNLNWRDVPLGKELQKHIQVPVYLENDANLAALAEHERGACQGARHSVTITLGAGVGSGLVLDGRLFTGGRGLGAELGHVPLIAGGEACSCGSRGCIERYCSASALLRRGQEQAARHPDSRLHAEKPMTAKVVVDCAKAGDAAAMAAFEQYVSHLSYGLMAVVTLLDPEVIAIGGGLSDAGDFLLNPVRESTARLRMYKEGEPCRIVQAALRNDAGLVGAGLLCAGV